jgi:SAM-dependent methyltransferase
MSGTVRMETLPLEFNEDDYLAANPDVAAAVQAGSIISGARHYELYGVSDRRALSKRLRPVPLALPFPAGIRATRRDKILSNLNLKVLQGVEIGALSSPLITVDEGNIIYVDHADTNALREKYSNDASVVKNDIVEVTAVWGAQTLQDCIGSDRKVDYVVASHVVEHVPNLIVWFQEIESILRPGGLLRLAVPDRRYSFDFLRFESRIHDVLDAYLQKVRSPLPRLIIEHSAYIRVVDCVKAWSGKLDPTSLVPYSTVKTGLDVAADALKNGTYHDTHCWVFTPVSFADLFVEMAKLDLLNFVCEQCIETPVNELEFYVHMKVSDDRNAIIASWEKMKSNLLLSSAYQK